MKLSTRNQIKGTVTKVTCGEAMAIVSMDIGNGNHITAAISAEAVRELGLEQGKEAIALIKATSVMVALP